MTCTMGYTPDRVRDANEEAPFLRASSRRSSQIDVLRLPPGSAGRHQTAFLLGEGGACHDRYGTRSLRNGATAGNQRDPLRSSVGPLGVPLRLRRRTERWPGDKGGHDGFCRWTGRGMPPVFRFGVGHRWYPSQEVPGASRETIS